MKRHAPATLRNREFILEALCSTLPERGLVLEIAAGTGEHAAFFAGRLPGLVWQPSDADPLALASIEAHRVDAGCPNLRAPIALDVRDDEWSIAAPPDAIVCINMIHIAPWAACEALVRGAARALRPGGALFLYGPFRIGGLTAPSNDAFDESLRARDPTWGVRELDEVTALADEAGFQRDRLVSMPANNHSVVFRHRA